MVVAMFLAHLIGDYILQWDGLARWKSLEWRGVLAHGTIVWLVTWLFSLPFNAAWWPWALFIGLTHTAVDALPLWLSKRVSWQDSGALALARYLLDQVVHVSIIIIALVSSGYLAMPSLAADLALALHQNRLLVFVMGYAFLTMPAWILVEFAVHGLVKGTAPDFSETRNRYVGILERGLITTFVMMGQFVLVPLVALPRLVVERPLVMGSHRASLYLTELLASVTLAVAVGLGLRWL